MGLLALIHLSAFIGALSIMISQIFAIISEASFYEKEKNHHIETHNIIIPSKNIKNIVRNFYMNLIII